MHLAKKDKWRCQAILVNVLLVLALLSTPQTTSAATDKDKLKMEVVSPLKRVFSSTSVTDQKNSVIEIWSARNEYESFQVAFHSDNISHVLAVEVTNLVKSKGCIIAAKQFEYRFLASVYINKHTVKTPLSEVEGEVPGWFPDPLDESTGLRFTGSHSLWGTWYVPRDTAPGDYRGKLIIRFENGVHRLPILLHVWGFTLPKKPSLYVTNWLHIRQVESQYNVMRGSVGFWKVIDKIAQDMAAHRQNVIFTPLCLVKSLELADGRYSFDFREYDKWVEIFLHHGFQVFEGSHLFHARNTYNIQRGSVHARKEIEFDLRRLATTEGRSYLSQLLNSLHKENGRLGIQKSYIQHVDDEAPSVRLQHYRDIAETVRTSMPGVPIIDATELPPTGLQGLMDVPVGLMSKAIVQSPWKAESKWGRWWYTASYPRGLVPNRFVDYPLVKMRMIPWLSWRHNVKGYLHYGYNWWFTPSKKSPWQDVEHAGEAPPGDGFVVYPSNFGKKRAIVSSMRWEAFRDGMEDYEYLCLLNQWANLSKGVGKTTLKQREALLRDIRGAIVDPEIYPRNPEVLLKFRFRLGNLLSELAKRAEKSE